MLIEYYKLWYRLHGDDKYLIWFLNETDGIYIDSSGNAPLFDSEGHTEVYAAVNGLDLSQEEPILHDLDAILYWLVKPDCESLDCSKILSAWNLFLDFTRSIPGGCSDFEKLDGVNNDIYNKIFYGNNLPAMAPEGEHYTPSWSDEEIDTIAELLRIGIDFFQSSLSEDKRWPSSILQDNKKRASELFTPKRVLI